MEQKNQHPQKKKEGQGTKSQYPKWLVNNEKLQLDNFPEPGCGMERNGIGDLKRQEVIVRDAGSVTPS